MNFKQIEPGKLDTKFVLHAGKFSSVARLSMSKRVHQSGIAPKNCLTFGIADTNTIQSWGAQRLPENALLHFDNEVGFDSVSGAGHSGVVASFERYNVEKIAASCGFDLSKTSNSNSIFRVENQIRQLQLLKNSIDSTLKKDVVTWSDGMEEQQILNFLSLLNDEGTRLDTGISKNRQRVFRRAIEYIESKEGLECSVATLCQEVGTSWRTLDRAFKAAFGFGPKKYTQITRLNRVRHEIITSDPLVPIWQIANRHDFWHIGQLAKDYSRLFGELPSDTRELVTQPNR